MLHIATKSGADLLTEVLKKEGVDYIFGNPGTTEMPLMHAMRHHPEIRYVLGLQETAVVAMADGYAKASGRPAFVNLHTAGGLGHAMGAMLHSHIARTPMVVTAGQQDTRHSFADPLLYGDSLKMAEPAVKWAREVQHPDHVPALVRRALQDSMTPPRGPVFLSLPIDVLNATTTTGAGSGSRLHRQAIAGGLDELAGGLAATEAGRLVIIAGDDVETSDAGAEVVTLAEMLGAKVYGPSWPGSMPFPTVHPLWCGNLPSSAALIRSELAEVDAVLVLGDNPFIAYPYSDGGAIPQDCKLFQLTQDGLQAGRTYTTEIACIGDLKASLTGLLGTLRGRMADNQRAVAAVHDIAETARSFRLKNLESRFQGERWRTPVTPFVAAGEALRGLGEEVAVVDEAPATMYHVRAFLERAPVRRYFFMRSAILGWGLPAAVGVSLGLGSAPVVALVGDGSALYSPQGLWTAAKLRLPVTFVIMNNAEYNILKRYSVAQGYEKEGNSTIPGMEINDPPVDYLALAASFGVRGRRATAVDEIEPMIRAAVLSGEPNLVEIVIGAE